MKKPYYEVQIRKKNIKKATLMIIFCFCTFFAVLFASFFAAPILNIAKIVSTNPNLFEKSYFFVMLNTQTTNKADATKEAQNIKSRGGAGVLLLNDCYNIAVSYYLNFDDAQKICNLLSTEEQTYFVEEQKIFFNTKNFNDEEKETLTTYLNFFITQTETIYNISNNLDKGITSQISANLKIRSIKLEVHSMCQKLVEKQDSKLEKLKNAFLNFESSLEYASNQQNLETNIVPYSSILREMTIHSIISFCNI